MRARGWGIDRQERKKLQIPGGVPGGGMVTGRIEPCISVLKNKTTCGKETTRLNQNYVQRMDQCRSCWTPGHSTHSTFSLGFLGDHCGRVSGRSQGLTSDHSFV